MGRVRDQARCGSCWAHAVCGMLESAYAIRKYGRGVPNLSEQYWVSCDPGNKGCDGGNTLLALWFARYSTGWWFEGEYPYKGANSPCSIRYPIRDLGFPKLR